MIKSQDGQIRSCKIKCKDRVITRAISLLYPLELTAESYVDRDNLEKADYLHNKDPTQKQYRRKKLEEQFVPAAPLKQGERQKMALDARKQMQALARDKRAAKRDELGVSK